MLVGPYTNKCPVNGTEVGVSMQSKNLINSDSYDFQVDIKNVRITFKNSIYIKQKIYT